MASSIATTWRAVSSCGCVRIRLDARSNARRKALLGDRLEQIVERGDLERADRILVVRGHEDHRRHALRSDRVDDREAVHPRHLHVEQHQVRRLLANDGDRLASVARFRYGLDAGLTAEQQLQPLARERLVVHDENLQSHVDSSPRRPEGQRNGDAHAVTEPCSRRRVAALIAVQPCPAAPGVRQPDAVVLQAPVAASPGPSSETIKASEPFALVALTSIVTASSL